jgi:hypothetical protein
MKSLIAGIAFTLLTLSQAHAAVCVETAGDPYTSCPQDNKPSAKKWFLGVEAPLPENAQCQEYEEDVLRADLHDFQTNHDPSVKRVIRFNLKEDELVDISLFEIHLSPYVRTVAHEGWFKSHSLCMAAYGSPDD